MSPSRLAGHDPDAAGVIRQWDHEPACDRRPESKRLHRPLVKMLDHKRRANGLMRIRVEAAGPQANVPIAARSKVEHLPIGRPDPCVLTTSSSENLIHDASGTGRGPSIGAIMIHARFGWLPLTDHLYAFINSVKDSICTNPACGLVQRPLCAAIWRGTFPARFGRFRTDAHSVGATMHAAALNRIARCVRCSLFRLRLLHFCIQNSGLCEGGRSSVVLCQMNSRSTLS
jgi:hypothetical protein